jgi:hypothetical protein
MPPFWYFMCVCVRLCVFALTVQHLVFCSVRCVNVSPALQKFFFILLPVALHSSACALGPRPASSMRVLGRNSTPILNDNLLYPDDLDRKLNETSADKIRDSRTDCYNRPCNSVSFMSVVDSTSVSSTVRFCVSEFTVIIGKPTAFFWFRSSDFGNILTKTVTLPKTTYKS